MLDDEWPNDAASEAAMGSRPRIADSLGMRPCLVGQCPGSESPLREWMPSRYVPEDRPLIGLRRGVIGLHYGLKLRWIRFDSVPVLEWIVITGSLDWAKG